MKRYDSFTTHLIDHIVSCDGHMVDEKNYVEFYVR